MTKMMEEIYQDQVMKQVHICDRTISSFYTPTGIQKIDARFANRIQAFHKGESFTEYSNNYSKARFNDGQPKKEVEQVWTDTHESLKKDIEENPHLHPTIKENLLYNLNRP